MARCLGESTLDAPAGTYFYTLAQSGPTFATIGSDDSLRLFDPSLKLLHAARPANAGISCLAPFTNSGFATAGRDTQVRCWDLRANASATTISEPKGAGISALACHDSLIAVGTESTKEGLGDVSVLLYDARNPSAPLRSFLECHTDSITQLAFHPTQPHVLLSGSTDGLVSLFDINEADEDDALQQVLNPRAAVHRAGFLSPTDVFVLTTDEHFAVYNLSAETPGSALDFGDARAALECTYVVDVVTSARPPAVVFGNHEREALGVAPLDEAQQWAFGPRIELPGAHGEEIVRDLLLLHAEGKAVSCGEDGKVKVWDLAGSGG